MIRAYLASTNAHKLEELSQLLEGSGLELMPLPYPIEVEENDPTFVGNARIKAHACARALGEPCLADDSGLAVDALDGRPGVKSARYESTDERRIAKLLGELEGVPDERRTAAFHCALVLAWPDGSDLAIEESISGRIGHAPRGEGGFGYDPIFELPERGKTFAELGAEKNRISHRARAAERLKEALRAVAGR